MKPLLRILVRTIMIVAVLPAPLVVHSVLAHRGLPLFAIPLWAAARTGLIAASALSHGAIYLGVGLLFGLSLRPGQEPLVSRLARRVEPCPTPELMAYTRAVTWLWAGFGAAQLAGS